jgi:hypothetical protein
MSLAAITKDLMERLSGTCPYLSIAVDETPPQPTRQMARNCAFAGRHEAGQD